MYANNENVIILTDRDKAEYEYLCKVRGEQSVVWASQNLAGKRKPYISNLAKILKVDIPNDLHIGVEVVSAEQAQMYLMDIKKILAGIKMWIYVGCKMDSIDVGSLKELPMEKLSEIARAAAKALQDKKHEELLSAWDNFANKANAIGMTVDDALNKCYKTGYKGLRTVPIKYRDPLNHNNVWSGRGRTPNWITEYKKEGKNANDFLVDKE